MGLLTESRHPLNHQREQSNKGARTLLDCYRDRHRDLFCLSGPGATQVDTWVLYGSIILASSLSFSLRV
jgi:hypothetical protein